MKIFTKILYAFITLMFILILYACNTAVKQRNTNLGDVMVLGINDSIPKNGKLISKIKVGYFPPYLSLYRNYDSIIISAKEKTAELGGNLLKITSHTPYQYNFRNNEITLHKIKGNVYYFEKNQIALAEKYDNTPKNRATLNFYMFYQGGATKNIYFNNSLIIKKMKSKSKHVYYTNNYGLAEIKCGKKGVPLTIDISPNQSYYLKCNIKLGMIRNTSFIEKKDSLTGTKELGFL